MRQVSQGSLWDFAFGCGHGTLPSIHNILTNVNKETVASECVFLDLVLLVFCHLSWMYGSWAWVPMGTRLLKLYLMSESSTQPTHLGISKRKKPNQRRLYEEVSDEVSRLITHMWH